MRIAILIAFLIFPAAARAEKSVDVDEGIKVVLKDGAVFLTVQGKPVWSKQIAQEVLPESQETLTRYAIQDDFRAVHAVVEDKSKSVIETVLLVRRGRTDIKIIWKERTDLEGDVGERTAEAVQFQDLTGDNLPEIIVGKVSEAHRLCGDPALPLLFRKVYDVKKGEFRPVLAKRPSLIPTADLEGSAKDAGTIVPLIDQISADAASRSAGDKGEVIFLAKPDAAVDGNPSTVWSPATGNGGGEFAAFHVASDVYGVTHVGIRPLPKVEGKVRYDRPKTLLLSTEKGVYRLVFKNDPALSPDAFVWFTLPTPDNTACLAVTVETTFGAVSKLPFALSEILVQTEVDEPNGIDRLARDLNTPKLRRQAAMLLKKAGPRVLAPIRAAWKTLNFSGRRLAAEVLSRTCAEAAVDLLAEAALGNDALTREAAIEGLRNAPEKAVSALEKHLSSKDAERFELAAQTLASLGTKTAVDALASRLGRTDRNQRRMLVYFISKSLKDKPEETEGLWAHFISAENNNERDRLSALLQAAAEFTSLQDRVFEKAGPLYDAASAFPDRYQLLEVLGRVSCGRSDERLMAATADPDLQIRAQAMRSIGSCIKGQTELNALNKGLKDSEPSVRLAALDAMFMGIPGNLAMPLQQLFAVAHNDPWPKVRADAVRLAGLFPRNKVILFLKDAAEDASPDVRETALLAVFQYFGKDADAIIEERLASDNETAKLKAAAAVAAGRRCQQSALPSLFLLLKKGAEPMADPSDVEVAAAAARAMGDIGTPEAVSMLKEIAKRSNFGTEKAVEAALKNPGAACAPSKPEKTVGKALPTPGETP